MSRIGLTSPASIDITPFVHAVGERFPETH
jgi:hypothetical protein